MMENENIIVTETKEKRICRVGIWAKVWACIGQVILSLVIAACFIASVYMITEGYYSRSFQQILDQAFREENPAQADFLIYNYVNGNDTANEYYCENGNIVYVNIYRTYAARNEWAYDIGADLDNLIYMYSFKEKINDITYNCVIGLGNNLRADDRFRSIYLLVNTLFTLRYAVYFIALICLIGWVLLYIFVLRNAGYAKKSNVAKPIFESYVPFEINLSVMAGSFLLAFFAEGTAINDRLESILLCVFIIAVLEVVFILWSICLAIRIKTGFIWKTMILRYIFMGLGALFKLIGRGFKALFKNMSFIWQAFLGIIILLLSLLLSAGMIGNFDIRTGIDATGWLIFSLILIAIAVFGVYISICYRKLEQKANRLAKGDLSGDAEMKYMLPLFKRHAQDLKTISGGIVISNEKRMASEKTQTALITNVSHDIKTPLTSIINYADLISKEESDNEKINEYAEVLGRQSTRLKRLLEDLIEVSKAQSGALEVNLEACEVSTLVNQAAGEFEEKLKENSLDLITKGTENGAVIMADPRRMWRVFDNLLGNICKYAQPFTRVYLNVEEADGRCRIIFKNTSARELDLSPEELMARFVRGDKSREGAEGNGLGLSIASNLVQLQKGTMEISIDGDLFKVTLEFPSESA